MKDLAEHIDGFVKYLSAPHERADEDLAIAYFRQVYGQKFTRQKEANLADGYVPGHFVLELKAKPNDWLKGLLQGLAYRRTLDFGSVVVAAKSFLAVWHLSELPPEILAAALAERDAANKAGERLAKRFAARRDEILALAAWRIPPEQVLDSGLYRKPDILAQTFREFEATLKAGERIRQKVTPANFTTILKNMLPFFDDPMKAVRAFYSIVFKWDAGTTVVLSERNLDRAAMGGEIIEHLVPTRRDAFKEFVERYAVKLSGEESVDDFFARFDEALDTVSPDFRRRHGIFFTDLELSKFAMWLVREKLGDIGHNHLVIDPACGSGNLVTNWRSPLELRHKVVSEIEPELLFAVERRMQGDGWHNGRFTVVPKVAEGKGLNFLDIDANEYLDTLRQYLKDKGHDPNKPIAFLCNPPYRSDDDQSASAIQYKVAPAITEITGADAASERYCCFLAQMKRICDVAKTSGLPGDSLLLVFTKVGWLTDRHIFQRIRTTMLGAFEDVAGIMVNSREFFDVKGKFPVGFSIWRYRPGAALNPHRSIDLLDLTWLTKKDLASVPWGNPEHADVAGKAILADPRAQPVPFGVPRESMRVWSGSSTTDFKRGRRKTELAGAPAGGLPLGDPRNGNKKAYGDAGGAYIGFMDNLTPCRVKRSIIGVPWFRLDSPIMDCRKGRCISGPPDQKGHVADTEQKADKLFLWYAIQRDFAINGYPMWADAMDLWGISAPPALAGALKKLTWALVFADNECIETRYPANNPYRGAAQLSISNPMSPNTKDSWWNIHGAPLFLSTTVVTSADKLVLSVLDLYRKWKKIFRVHHELPLDSDKAYYVGASGFVTASSGLLQIRDYINQKNDAVLASAQDAMLRQLDETKSEFHRILLAKEGLDYFGPRSAIVAAAPADVAVPGGIVKAKSRRVAASKKSVASESAGPPGSKR